MLICWLRWSVASGGTRPWAIYAANPDCNYPPFVLYVLTVSQACINALHAIQTGPLAVLIIKLPNLLACVIGVPLCVIGMRILVGQPCASRTAAIYLFCLPLWFNAAIWGQWDALSSLAMVATMLAVANHRPAWAGIALGWAFSIKLHAIILLPATCVYIVRRWTRQQTSILLISAITTWLLIALPFFISGQGQPVIRSYTGAVNFYPGLTQGAFNPWQLVQFYNLKVRHLPAPDAGFDGQIILGPISARSLGLMLFALYTLWLCAILNRWPTRINLISTAAMTAAAFFMLPTQVHQRYLVPAAALFALVAMVHYRLSYLLIMLAALINQWVVLEFERRGLIAGITESDRQLFMQLYCICSVLNLIGFCWITWHHHRQTSQRRNQDFSQGQPC